jgi:hypothetical protein
MRSAVVQKSDASCQQQQPRHKRKARTQQPRCTPAFDPLQLCLLLHRGCFNRHSQHWYRMWP